MTAKQTMSKSELVHALAQATDGLLLHSESDAPIVPYRWPASVEPSPEALLKAEGRTADEPVEVETVHELFDPRTEEQSFWNDDDRAEAARYKALVALLEEALTDLRVLRIGKASITVFVLGRHASGDWMGVSTRLVET